MSDLRTRIAQVIHRMDGVKCCDECQHHDMPSLWALDAADAVMKELHLHVEHGTLKVIRYVSDWEINDNS